MKNLAVPLIFLFFSLTLYGQKVVYYDSLWNKCDTNSAKYYRIIERIEDNNYYSLRDFYISGEPQMEVNVSSMKKEIKEGKCIWYYKNGVKKSEVLYKKGKRVGYFRTFFENGKLDTEGNFINNKREGVWTYWDNYGNKTELESVFKVNLSIISRV